MVGKWKILVDPVKWVDKKWFHHLRTIYKHSPNISIYLKTNPQTPLNFALPSNTYLWLAKINQQNLLFLPLIQLLESHFKIVALYYFSYFWVRIEQVIFVFLVMQSMKIWMSLVKVKSHKRTNFIHIFCTFLINKFMSLANTVIRLKKRH